MREVYINQVFESFERSHRKRDNRRRVRIDGQDIYAPSVDVTELRKKVGMVFQKPNPFPKTIYENVVYGPRVLGINKKSTPGRDL